MTCQYLGELGFEYLRAGSVDSMLTCYLEGIEVADRHRLPEQAGRLRRFLADYYVDQGRFSVAMQLTREAQSACRRWGGAPFELPTVLWTMERFADLGCWDAVRNLLQRLKVLLRALGQTAHDHEFQIYSLRARRLEARLLAADGRPNDAASIQSEILEPARYVHGPDSYGPLHAEYASSLLEAGRPREALEVATRGIAGADSAQQTELAIRLAALRVRAALALDDLELARSALHDHRARLDAHEPGSGMGRCENAALEARIALAAGRADVALRISSRAVHDLHATVRRMDAGPYSCLALADAEDLREVTHGLLAHDAGQSYRFELAWRSLAGRLGRGDEVVAADSVARVSALEPAGTRSIHLVYGFVGGVLTRWTKAAGTVRREQLPVSWRECDRRVESLMRMLARDPGDALAPMPDSLRAECAALGRLLLPRELREGPPARLIVSAEGSVARLPFEVLDMGVGPAYEPLLARHDVVYARPVPPLHRPAGSRTSLILLDGEDARREPVGLASASSEAESVRAWLPKARIVASDETSKRDLLAAWSHASILYVVSHLERDPVAPLLCHFPMAFGASLDRPEDSQLDLLDARTVDLRGCELVVLSACASGEPYVVGMRSGPSMADALLDAGARAVIHTRWRVRDDRASQIGPQLAQAWLDADHDPVASWSQKRREMLRVKTGWRHPFEWATWSVTVGLPTARWDEEAAEVMTADAAPVRPARAPRGENRVP